MKKIDVTYKEVNTLIGKIVEQIKEEGIIINNIIGISRGGLVGARLLASKLNVRKIYSIGIEFYEEGKEEGKNPKIYQELPRFIGDETYLIVDDIIQTSTSIKIAEKHSRLKGAKNVYTSVLYVKEGHGIMPDFFGSMVDNKEWVTFPWEG